jgi:hypothetical protein
MKRTLFIIGCTIFILSFVCTKKARTSMIDPLIGTSLTPEQIRTYRYLLALQEISLGREVDHTLQVEDILIYLQNIKAAYCSCGRWFLEEIKECLHQSDEYNHDKASPHVVMVATPEHLNRMIADWELFRSRYYDSSNKGGRYKDERKATAFLTRRNTINLFYYAKHLIEG